MSKQEATRFYEFIDAKSHKFWEAKLKGKEVEYSYGKWQARGTSKTKKFDSEELASKDFEKSCKQKEKAGYQLSDPDYPISLKQEIEEAIKANKTEFSMASLHPQAWIDICQIKTLQKLSVHCGDALKKLPDEIGELTEMENLLLDSNGLRSLPKSIGKLKKLRRLYAYHNKLATLPDSLCECTALEDLSLWSNELTEIPESIGKLSKLTELDVHGNQLTALPDSIGDLKELDELDIHDNKITELPDTLVGCDKLRELDTARNQLRALPDNIGGIKSLEILKFGRNPMPQLPESIGELHNLIELNCTGGWDPQALKALPDSMKGMPKLNTVELHNCQFTEVPEVLRHLPALESLELDDCDKIKNVPEDILDDKDAIFEHLGWVDNSAPSIEAERLKVPEEKERKKIVKAKQEQLDHFLREIRSYRKDSAQKVIDYVSGKTDELPNIKADEARRMEELEYIFGEYRDWTFVEERALAICATRFRYKTNSYYSGFYEALCRWVKKEITRNPPQTMFSEVAARLNEYGIDHLEIITSILDDAHNSLVHEGELTSVGEYFGEQLEEHGEKIVDIAFEEKATSSITQLLLRRGDITPHLPRLLKNKEYDDMVHPPLMVIKALVAYDKEKYEYAIHDGIETGSKECLVCNSFMGQILADNYLEKHRDLSFQLTSKTLELASAKRNSQDSSFFRVTSKYYYDKISKYFEWIFKTYGKDAKPLAFKFLEDTKVLDIDVVEVCARHLGQDGLPLVAEALNMKLSKKLGRHYQRVFKMLKPLNYSEYYPKIWELATCEFEDIQDAAALALAWQKIETFKEAAEKLESIDKAERLGSAKVLRAMSDGDSTTLLAEALKDETDETIRDILGSAVYRNPVKISVGEAKARIEETNKRGKLKKWGKKWLENLKLPLPKFSDGQELTAEEVRYLYFRQNRVDSYEVDAELRDVLDTLEPTSSAAFAKALLDGVERNGGMAAKNRPLLVLIGKLSSTELVPELESAGSGRNENAIRMLGLQGSIEAAAALERIRRQYTVKYPNIREAAEECFGQIAESRGITENELRDHIVPDLGFVHGEYAFSVAKDTYKAVLNHQVKLEYLSPEGKRTKSVPKAADKKAKAELKQLSKELTELKKEYKGVIEDWLVVGRKWEAETWRDLFMQNAFLFASSQGLVWGLFHDAKLIAPFSVNADKTLETIEGEKVSILAPNWTSDFTMMLGMIWPKPYSERKKNIDIKIGLLHPINIEQETREAWLAKQKKLKIMAPIRQLDREVITVSEESALKGILYDFENQEVGGGTFKGRANRLGWRRGSVVDSGGISAFYRHYPEEGIDAFITTENLGVNGYGDEKAKLKELFFVPHGSVVTGSYTYDEPRNDRDERLIKAGEVPTIVFSETIANLRYIVGDE